MPRAVAADRIVGKVEGAESFEFTVFEELDTTCYPEEQKTIGWPLVGRIGAEITF